MARPRRRTPLPEDTDLVSRTGPRRRDSDWGGSARTHEEDLAWAAKRAAVTMAAATIHAQDCGTGAHSDDVVHLCDAIAEDLGIHGHDRAEMLAAAQLHDIGKVAIPNEVLNKPGPLDDSEWALVREHTLSGETIVQSVPELMEVARLVRHSHERWDGGGYPDGLAGEEIPFGSRIVFCADAYHAIRSDRPYRKGRSARAALEEVRSNAGSQFDPRVVDALERASGELRRSAGVGRGLAMTMRSRRLMSLLLTLAIGGSALAAGGSHLLGDEGGGRGDKDPPPASSRAVAPPVKPGASAEDKASADAAAANRDAGRSADRAGARARASSPAWSDRRARPAPAARRRGADAPTRTRTGRPQSPGRSNEAPGRPARPGKPPVAGAPGRSEAAPRRPEQRVTPPANAVKPQRSLLKVPAAEPRGNANAP